MSDLKVEVLLILICITGAALVFTTTPEAATPGDEVACE
jgi:hypothetical protein